MAGQRPLQRWGCASVGFWEALGAVLWGTFLLLPGSADSLQLDGDRSPEGGTCFQRKEIVFLKFLFKNILKDFSCAEANKNIHTVLLPARGSNHQR